MTSHLEDGTLHELLDGEIPSGELGPIQVHLASCAECRARLDTARMHVSEADDLIEALDAPTPPAVVAPPRAVTTRYQPWHRHLAWAASIAIAVGTGYYARGSVGIVDGGTPTVLGESQSVATRTQDTLSQLPAADVARERTAPVATRKTAAPEPATPILRDATRSDATAASEAANAPPATGSTMAERRQADGDSTERLRADRIGNVLALQPGMVSSPAAGAPGGRPEPKLVPRDQAVSKQAAVDTISFQDAVRILGGRLRLIEGLVPVRLEAVGREVRVIYPITQGELVLAQSVVGGASVIRLTAPANFPADSLAVLRRKVQ